MRRNLSHRSKLQMRTMGYVFVGVVFATLVAACQVQRPIDERQDPPPQPDDVAAVVDDVELRSVGADDDEDVVPDDVEQGDDDEDGSEQ